MNTNLPLNNNGLVLVAINGKAVQTAPASSVSLLSVINVFPSSVVDITGATVKTVRVMCAGTRNTPDFYDFAQSGEADATATAGATVGSVTTGDEWVITVDGVPFTYEGVSGNTPAQVRTAMTALLTANTQRFTVSSTLVGSAILYTIHPPAGSTSYWNGRIVTSEFPTNDGPTFSLAVESDFVGGSGIAEQFQAFLTDQSLTASLPIYTGLLTNNATQVKNGPSFMINSKWIASSNYDGTNTTIIYQPPLLLQQSCIVAGDQTAASSTFNV